MRSLLLLLCLTFATSFTHSQAQHHDHSPFEDPGHLTCAKHEMTQQFFNKYPSEAIEAVMAKAELENFTQDYETSGERGSQTLTIPVVFHVVHAGGQENISDAQIHSAMEVMNEDFNAQTPGIGSVVSSFVDVIGDVNIEFRLARNDPEGNCTNGILRVESQTTFAGGFDLLDVSSIWPRNRYLNIYVCDQISGGAAGFTLIPSSVNGPNGAQIDAIYITHPYVGRVGTGNSTRSHALSHEVGHWLNLEHTWGETNTPGLLSNCGGDDGVADTPNTIGWTSCDLSGVTCGTLDNVQNFMDYAYCYRMFTAGQAIRMRAALQAPIAQRNQLYIQSNLTFTGVNAPDEICEVDFRSLSGQSFCVGAEIVFEDLSFHGVTSHLWVFEGGSPATSSEANPTVFYDEPGTYDVSLTVSNAQGSSSLTKEGFVSVIPLGENEIPFTESFEGMNALGADNNWFAVDPDQETTRSWELYEGAGYSGNKSAYVNGRFNTNGAVEWLFSPTYDLSNVVGSNAVLSFKYAHARRNNTSDDQLRVWITRDCGETWFLRRTISMNDLPTVTGNVVQPFVPNNQSQWAEVEVASITSTFLNSEFQARFEFRSFNGNNIYIDDIHVYDPATLSANEFLVKDQIKLFPNPASNFTTLEYSLAKQAKVNVDLIDVSGKLMQTLFSADKSSGTHVYQFDVNQLSPGVYFVRFTANGEAGVQKLMVH